MILRFQCLPLIVNLTTPKPPPDPDPNPQHHNYGVPTQIDYHQKWLILSSIMILETFENWYNGGLSNFSSRPNLPRKPYFQIHAKIQETPLSK